MTESDRIRGYMRAARWRPGAGRDHLIRERRLALKDVALSLATPFHQLSVCDIGCGDGDDLLAWREWGVPEARLAGTELIPSRAASAQRELPAADIRTVDGFVLPFPSGMFSIVTASLVISTVKAAQPRRQLLEEMRRVAAGHAIVVVYDFAVRKPWNQNVKAVRTRELSRLWRPPDHVRHAAPFLPGLDLVLRAPRPVSTLAIRMLPRTHRLWVWSVTNKGLR